MHHRLLLHLRHCLIPILLICSLSGCGREPGLTVAAAASLREAFGELGALYAQAHQTPVRFSFAASGLLKAQIERGAPYDLFASASSDELAALAKAGKLAGAPRVFASNRLVLVKARAGAACDWATIGAARLAIGNPTTVPAGRYARAALQSLKRWDAVQKQLILTENVRQAADYLRTGEVEYAIVYATDAAQFKLARCQEFAAGSYPPIRLPAAVLAASAQPEQARAWLDFLMGAEARAILARHGFGPP